MRLANLLLFFKCFMSTRFGQTLFERVYHFLLGTGGGRGTALHFGKAERVQPDALGAGGDIAVQQHALPPTALGQSLGVSRRTDLTHYDLFLPAGGPTGSSPLVVFLHGGAWVASDKCDPFRVHPDLATALAARGVSVVNANYPLACSKKGVGIAEQVAYLSLLLEHLLREDTAHCRQAGIVLSGHSAGALLAMLVALKAAPKDGGSPPYFHFIRGVFAISGVYDLPDFWRRCGLFVRHLALSHAIPHDRRLWDALSPRSLCTASLPFPVRLVHGEREGFLLTQAQEFTLRLQATLNRVSLRVLSAHNHFSILNVAEDQTLIEDYLAFQADCELVVSRSRSQSRIETGGAS